MTERTLTLPPLSAADARAAAWLREHLERDPALADIFLEAAETTWQPLIKFVTRAVDTGLLRDAASPAERRAER
jgi:hypothetical protein